MATILPTFSKIRGPAGGVDAVVTTWTPLAAAGDIGQPLQRTDLADRSVQVTGTFAGAATIAEVTPDNMIREFEQARSLAVRRGQASAAVTATLAKARLAGLLNERSESNAEPPAKFDGNYAEAARRISLLLRLANHQITRVKSVE